MPLALSHTTVNALDACAQSRWWADLLGYHENPEDPNEPGDEECPITSPDGSHTILFIEVPDAKQLRNRIHFDLRPTERNRDDEVDRLVGMGVTMLEDRRTPEGYGWVVFADPEGNEFCVLRRASDPVIPLPEGHA